MAYSITTPYVGAQPIANTETVQKHPLGTIVRAIDPTYGEGEFIYLLGVASTAVGNVVTYTASTYTTALAPAGTNVPQPIAVAMSANVASQYGWYQIGGVAVAVKNATTATLPAGAAVGITTAGILYNTSTGSEIQGAVVGTTATVAVSTVQVTLNRPHMQGRIT